MGKPHFKFLVVFFLSACLVFTFHTNLIFNLNSSYLGNPIDGISEDGIKNYYTPIYHLKHDSTYLKFEGMNYPYGEHVVFTDNLPHFTNAIKFLAQFFPSLKNKGIACLNGFMLLSLILSSLFLFLILKMYAVNTWWSVWFSVLIPQLSPQLLRLSAHYALALTFIIPLFWYLILRFYRHKNYINSIIIGAALFIFSGLHLYYFALCSAFLGLIWLVDVFILLQNKKSIKRELIWLVVQVFVPLIFILLWINAFNEAGYRPKNPYGFLIFSTSLEGLFLPVNKPIGSIIYDLFHADLPSFEQISYLGLSITLATILFLVYFVKTRPWKGILDSSLKLNIMQISLLAASILLVFSLGFPFNVLPKNLLEFLGPIRQFRGIGRFSWVFFYVANVSLVIYLYQKNKTKFLFLFLVVLSYDVFTHNFPKPYSINHIDGFDLERELDVRKYNSTYQAILGLPYFHVGSENLSIINETTDIKRECIETSYYTGLPMFNVQLSRTDYKQTLCNIQLVLFTNKSPTILSELIDRRPILVIADTSQELSRVEKQILALGEFVENNGQYQYRTVRLDVFEKIAQSFLENNKNLQAGQRTILFDDFEDSPHIINHNGKGSFKLDLSDWNELPEVHVNSQYQQCEVSFWLNIKQEGVPRSIMVTEGYDNKGEMVFWDEISLGKHIVAIENNWAKVEYVLPTKQSLTLKFLVKSTFLKTETFIDDFHAYEMISVD